jgi:hypothetical protein
MNAKPLAWEGGKCRVPMWMMGSPAGFCGNEDFGPQLPREVLRDGRGWHNGSAPYCSGPCCPEHGGPKKGEPIVFQDGLTERGYAMYCAVMPDFEDLQASPAGFDGNGNVAIANLRAAIDALPLNAEGGDK